MTVSKVDRTTVRMVGRSFRYLGHMPAALRLAYESGRVRFGDVAGSGRSPRGSLAPMTGVVGTVVDEFDARESRVVAVDRAWDAPALALAEEASDAVRSEVKLSEPGEFVFETVVRQYSGPSGPTAPVTAATVAVVGYEVAAHSRKAHEDALERMVGAGVAVSDGALCPMVVGVPLSLGGLFVPADVEAAHRRSAALLDVALSMAPSEIAAELAASGPPGWFLMSTTRLSAPWMMPESAR